MSRFQNDVLLYSQNHFGYTFPEMHRAILLFWNGNLVKDQETAILGQLHEQGPGLKFRIKQMPPALSFSVNALKGYYAINQGNPHAPTFYDLRAGFWYAFTH